MRSEDYSSCPVYLSLCLNVMLILYLEWYSTTIPDFGENQTLVTRLQLKRRKTEPSNYTILYMNMHMLRPDFKPCTGFKTGQPALKLAVERL